eukprot:TRINITY_DN3936_c0_g1_i2.p1 TRINITY_DN3936_c0_g1~~TRINITY_DN3936_c0_g1_i2.p1  ORF type:complete len:1186 (+),score=429.88 TRINITY_DN3936_c0_g1_i2:137-3694(+)
MRSYRELEDRVLTYYLRHNPQQLQAELAGADNAATRTELRDWAASFIEHWATEPQMWAALRAKYGEPEPLLATAGTRQPTDLLGLLGRPPKVAQPHSTLTIGLAAEDAPAKAVVTARLETPHTSLLSPILPKPPLQYPPALGIPTHPSPVDLRVTGGRMAKSHLLELGPAKAAREAGFEALGQHPTTELLSDLGWWLPHETVPKYTEPEKQAAAKQLSWVEDVLAYTPVPVDRGLKQDPLGFEAKLARSIARRDLVVNELIDKIARQEEEMKKAKQAHGILLARLVRARQEYERVRQFKPLLPEKIILSTVECEGWEGIADAPPEGQPPEDGSRGNDIVTFLRGKVPKKPQARKAAPASPKAAGAGPQDVLLLVDITTAPPYAETRQVGYDPGAKPAPPDPELSGRALFFRAGAGAAPVAAALAMLAIATIKTKVKYKYLTFPAAGSVTASLGATCYDAPGTDAKKIGTHKNNTKLSVAEVVGGWARVTAPEPCGWVALKSTSGAAQVDLKEDAVFANLFKPAVKEKAQKEKAPAGQPTPPCKGVVKAEKGTMARKEQAVSSAEVKKLAAGTSVDVADIKGRRARITAPVEGWVSISNAAGTVLVELIAEKKEDEEATDGAGGKEGEDADGWWVGYTDPDELLPEELREGEDGVLPELPPDVTLKIAGTPSGSIPDLQLAAECVPFAPGAQLWEEHEEFGFVLSPPTLAEFRGAKVPTLEATLKNEEPGATHSLLPDSDDPVSDGDLRANKKKKNKNRFLFSHPPLFRRAHFVRVPLDPFEAHRLKNDSASPAAPTRLNLSLNVKSNSSDTLVYCLYHRPPEEFGKEDQECPPDYEIPPWLKEFSHMPQYEVGYAWRATAKKEAAEDDKTSPPSTPTGAKKEGALFRVPMDVYGREETLPKGTTMTLTYDYIPPGDRAETKKYPGVSEKPPPPHPKSFILLFAEKLSTDRKPVANDDAPKEAKWKTDMGRMPWFQPGARVVVPKDKWHPGQLLKQVKNPEDPLDGMWQVLMDRSKPADARSLRMYAPGDLAPWFSQTKRLYLNSPDLLEANRTELKGFELDTGGARDRDVLMTVVALDAKGIGPGGGGDMLAWGQVVVRPKEFFRDRDHTVDVELRKPLADHKIEKFSANGTITSKDPPPIEVMPKPKADHPIEGAGMGTRGLTHRSVHSPLLRATPTYTQGKRV